MHHCWKQPTLLLAVLFSATALLGFDTVFAQQAKQAQQDNRASEDRSTSQEKDASRDQGDETEMPTFVSDSNTGYIDNAIIDTRFRLRLDSGTGVDSPDRAEFFYGACGCARVVPNPPDNVPNAGNVVLNPNAPGPVGTVIPGAILTSPLIETDLDYQEVRLDFEYALADNFSVFAELPVRFVDGAILGSESGLGDVRAGFKWGLLNNPYHHLTFQVRGYFPSGDSEKGLGTDHESIEPGLLYFGRLNERWTMAAELRYWVSINGTDGLGTGFDDDYAGKVLRYGLGFGYDFPLASGRTLTPVVEVVGWSVRNGLALSSADGTPLGTTVPGFGYRDVGNENITNLKLGLRLGMRQGRSLYVGYGTALSSDVWYDDVVRVEYRLDFGS